MTRHLLHVGFPKSGSTYLKRWFELNPQIRYAERGIAGFHDVFHIARQARVPGGAALWAVTSYEGFTAPMPSAGYIEPDYGPLAMPMHVAQEEACRSLAELFPNAHVLMVTRGFRSMIMSSFSQYARSGGTRDLDDLFNASLDDHPWAYDRVITSYRKYFGAEKLILLPYELLQRDPGQFIAELEARLGTEPRPPLRQPINPSLSATEMRWYPRLTRAIDGLPLPRRLRRAVRSAYVKGALGNRWRPAIRLLQLLWPLEPVDVEQIPGRVLNRFRGEASMLAAEPLYAPFAEDYLF